MAVDFQQAAAPFRPFENCSIARVNEISMMSTVLTGSIDYNRVLARTDGMRQLRFGSIRGVAHAQVIPQASCFALYPWFTANFPNSVPVSHRLCSLS